MRALVIGAAGFVGHYLLSHLRDTLGWTVIATKLPGESIHLGGTHVVDLDILNAPAVITCLQEAAPEVIFHLAALSSVHLSWEKPEDTVRVNVIGSLHVLEAMRVLHSKARVLLIGSGEVYGEIREDQLPLQEDSVIRPLTPYAVTKAAQEMMGIAYAKAYGLSVIGVRAFNHVGPGQMETFVVADFSKQIAEIECGKQAPVIRVGNLSARRDFTDVRDVVHAYALLAEKGVSGEIYNVGRGEAISIQRILDMLLSISSVKMKVEQDIEKFRPVDIPVIAADIVKITADTGWQPLRSLDDTLRDILDEWRAKVSKEGGNAR